MKKPIARQTINFILFFIVSTAVIIGGSFYFISNTKADVNSLNKNFLSEIASQNANIMKKTVQIHLDKLSAISNVIGNQAVFSIENAMSVLTSESQRSSFKRMGYADREGNAITTDGQAFDISARSYYKKAMKGKDSVSDRLIDKVGGAYINVYAVPLYHHNTIIGVIFATNKNDDFIDLLSSKTFGGEGFSYVIKQDGSPIAYSNKKSSSSSDLASLFDEMDNTKEGKEKVNIIKNDMLNEDDGFLTYSWNGIERIGAYCKTGIEDWYAVTLVSKSVIASNTDRIIIRNIAIVSLTCAIFIALLLMIVLQNHKSKKSLEKIAYNDDLIGCMNFKAFKKVAQLLLNDTKEDTYIFVKFDVENFKFVNDRFGFKTGDEVLKNIANGLREVVTSGTEAFARIDADEFIIMLKDKHEHFLEDIRDSFVQIFNDLMGAELNHLIRFHSGLYIVEKDEKEVERIYEKVNYAHRQSKLMTTEGDIVEFYYNDAVKARAMKKIEIEDTMMEALLHDRFEVFIQPKYRLDDETISGGEALVRWRQPDGSLMYPGAFIPLFEENGFIIKLDMYMFDKICKTIQQWMKQDMPVVCISVNFSRLHLFNTNFVKRLIEISDFYQVPRNLIELELTETVFFENETLLENVLVQAHEAGFTMSMDDFGNGYSSLGLLKNINVDVIKVDRNFFVDDKDEQRTRIVVEYVMKMAQKLGVHTLAEGIETQDHIDMLKSIGCDYVQGYYYAKPMPIKDFEERLKNDRANKKKG